METNTKPIKPKRDWKKILKSRKWDYALLALLFICSCTLLFFIIEFDIFYMDNLWKIIAILLVGNGICIGLLFFKQPDWLMWIRRLLILFLSGALLYASFSVDLMRNSLQAITKPETATTVNVSLLTKKDGGLRSVSSLSGKKIGIQNANDVTNAKYVKDELAKEEDLENEIYIESDNYSELYKKLQSGEIDALIMTDYFFKTLLKDEFPTIEEDIFLLKSYQKQKDIAMNLSGKDIRYEPFTVYIGGVDEGDDLTQDARSDVNIVLIVNPLANHIEMLSIPRDAFVPNPALNNQSDKLTHLGLNGIENSVKGLENVLNFPIDFYVKLNFFSVIEIIDAIGKIEVDVPATFCEQDEYRSFEEEDLICLNEGTQEVDGKQALGLARHRKTYGDIQRGKAQQEIIQGIIQELTTPSGILKMNDVMRIAPKYISTNMPMEQITNFISEQSSNLKPWTIDSLLLENGADASLLTASMPSTPLSVLLLNQFDIQNAFETYHTMFMQMKFNQFTFNLNDLKSDKNIPTFTSNAQVVWAGQNTNRYEQKEEEETTPEAPTPPVTPPVQEQPPVNTPTPPVETPVTPPVVDPTPPVEEPTPPAEEQPPNQSDSNQTNQNS